MKTKWIAPALALFLATPLVACQEEGPAERAGKQMDEAAGKAAGSLEELGQEIGEAADESKEAAKKLRDSVGE